jgi:gas vesicle protein
MKDQNKSPSNFWFGFSLGMIAAVAATYLIGTKKGRELLKKIVDLSEHFPEKLPELVEELEKVFTGKNNNKLLPKLSSIETVINKIKQSANTARIS